MLDRQQVWIDEQLTQMAFDAEEMQQAVKYMHNAPNLRVQATAQAIVLAGLSLVRLHLMSLVLQLLPYNSFLFHSHQDFDKQYYKSGSFGGKT